MGQADLDPLTADHDRAADRYPPPDQLRDVETQHDPLPGQGRPALITWSPTLTFPEALTVRPI
jgi:hypothetical protein